MLFRWSTHGKDLDFLSLSVRSLSRFFPKATLVVFYNGKSEGFTKTVDRLKHLPVQVFDSNQYEWPFEFDGRFNRKFWKKWWPFYTDIPCDHQMHIDNDIFFFKKPERFTEWQDQYDIYTTQDSDDNYLTCCGCFAQPLMDRGFKQINSGIWGLKKSALDTFVGEFRKTAHEAYNRGESMDICSEQGCFGYAIQHAHENKDLNVLIEHPQYVRTFNKFIYETDNVNVVALHFLSNCQKVARTLFPVIERVFTSDWDQYNLDIIKSIAMHVDPSTLTFITKEQQAARDSPVCHDRRNRRQARKYLHMFECACQFSGVNIDEIIL